MLRGGIGSGRSASRVAITATGWRVKRGNPPRAPDRARDAARYTCHAATRSWNASPTPPYTVVSSGVVRPGCAPASTSPSSASMAFGPRPAPPMAPMVTASAAVVADEDGAADHVGAHLALPRLVGPERRHVRPWGEHAREEKRRPRPGRDENDAGVADGRVDRAARCDGHPERRRHPRRERRRALGDGVEDRHAADGPEHRERAQLVLALDPRPDDGHRVGVATREHVGRERPGEPGPHGGQMGRVHDREEPTCPDVVQAEDAADRRPLVRELRVHLDAVRGDARRHAREEHGGGTRPRQRGAHALGTERRIGRIGLKGGPQVRDQRRRVEQRLDLGPRQEERAHRAARRSRGRRLSAPASTSRSSSACRPPRGSSGTSARPACRASPPWDSRRSSARRGARPRRRRCRRPAAAFGLPAKLSKVNDFTVPILSESRTVVEVVLRVAAEADALVRELHLPAAPALLREERHVAVAVAEVLGGGEARAGAPVVLGREQLAEAEVDVVARQLGAARQMPGDAAAPLEPLDDSASSRATNASAPSP